MEIKVESNGVWVPVQMTVAPIRGERRVCLSFPYNPVVMKLAKSLEEARWMPERKMWHGKLGERTEFRLQVGVQGMENPYKPWRIPADQWPEIEIDRPYMKHQVKAIRQALATVSMIWAQEMRTGKTLQGIKVMEVQEVPNLWWVSNRSGIAGVKVDFRKWKTNLNCTFMTYEEAVKRISQWRQGDVTPSGLVLDEMHKTKNPETQRTYAIQELVKGMRADHGNPPIVAMSGTCAPKDPTDWWSPIEIMRPGYLQENNIANFKKRLSLTVDGQSATGGWFPVLRTWFDNPDKCKICGLLENGQAHEKDKKLKGSPGIHNTKVYANLKDKENYLSPHVFQESIDEVQALGNRLDGMVHTQFKKDCEMDLPDMTTEYWYYNNGWQLTMDLSDVVIVPDESFRKMSTEIRKTSEQAVIRDLRLRELSDGFQYKYEDSDETITCPECNGEGECMQFDEFEEEVFEECWKCDGKGKCFKQIRVGNRINTPKDQRLREDLEQFEATNRMVVFTAFTESTDRVVEICLEEDWSVIRVDGRGWNYIGKYEFDSDVDALEAFADKTKYPRLAFVGHPKSGGLGISLSASSCIVFYSNSDAADDKEQGAARIHDLGMDKARGAVIKEYFHLEVDIQAIHRYLIKIGLDRKVRGGILT